MLTGSNNQFRNYQSEWHELVELFNLNNLNKFYLSCLFTICLLFVIIFRPKNQIWLVMTFVVSKLDVGSGEHDKFVCLTWWAGEEYFFTSSTSSLSIVGGFQILASFSSLKTIFLSKSIAIVPKRKCNYVFKWFASKKVFTKKAFSNLPISLISSTQLGVKPLCPKKGFLWWRRI